MVILNIYGVLLYIVFFIVGIIVGFIVGFIVDGSTKWCTKNAAIPRITSNTKYIHAVGLLRIIALYENAK